MGAKTGNLEYIFRFLSLIHVPSKAIDKAQRSSKEEAAVNDFITEIRKGLALLHKVKVHQNQNRPWDEIFHRYMVSVLCAEPSSTSGSPATGTASATASPSSSSSPSSSAAGSSSSVPSSIESDLLLDGAASSSAGGASSDTQRVFEFYRDHYKPERDLERRIAWWDFLSNKAETTHYESVFNAVVTLSHEQSGAGSPFPTEYVHLSVTLAAFLRTHHSDPFGCVIGQRVAPSVLEQLRQVHEHESLELEQLAANAARVFDHKALVLKVFEWASMSALEELQARVRSFAAILRGVTTMENGELVVVQLRNDVLSSASSSSSSSVSPSSDAYHYVYGRYTGERHGERTVSVLVGYEPESLNATVLALPIDSVFPLNSRLLERVQYKPVYQLEAITESPLEDLNSSLVQLVEMRLCERLASECHFSREIYDRAVASANTFKDKAVLTKATKVLADMNTEFDLPSSPWLQQLYSELASRVHEVFATLHRCTAAFAPTRNLTLHRVAKSNTVDIVRNSFLSLQAVLLAAAKQLESSKRSWIDGSKKRELTEWWLDIIEQKVCEVHCDAMQAVVFVTHTCSLSLSSCTQPRSCNSSTTLATAMAHCLITTSTNRRTTWMPCTRMSPSCATCSTPSSTSITCKS